MSALATAARLSPVLDGLGLRVCSTTVRERLLDVEGPATRHGARPYLSVIDVRVHVLDVSDAERLAAVLGLREVSREVHGPASYSGAGATVAGLEAREHVTWAGLVTLPLDLHADQSRGTKLLRVEVLALGPAPALVVMPEPVPGAGSDTGAAVEGVAA